MTIPHTAEKVVVSAVATPLSSYASLSTSVRLMPPQRRLTKKKRRVLAVLIVLATDQRQRTLQRRSIEPKERTFIYQPPITYTHQHGWTMDDPDNHFFHDERLYRVLTVRSTQALQETVTYSDSGWLVSRFDKAQIQQLITILDLGNISWTNRNSPTTDLAVCIFLHRMSMAGAG